MLEHTEAVSLRERRRRATLGDIAAAAVQLFEEHGVAGTTVEQIAAAAGVSSRTVFRYCRTKEHAVIPGDDDISLVTHRVIARLSEGLPVFDAIEEGWLLWLLEVGDEDRYAYALRVRRLMQNEPTLLSVVLTHDAERNQRLHDAVLLESPEADPLFVQGAIATVAALAQAALAEGARRSERAEPPMLTELYLQMRRGLSQYLHNDVRVIDPEEADTRKADR